MPRAHQSRTVLAQCIRDRRLTFEEFAEQLEIFARENNEAGMLGLRHVQRLAAGQLAPNQLRAATVRLLEKFWNTSIDELLASPVVPAKPAITRTVSGELVTEPPTRRQSSPAVAELCSNTDELSLRSRYDRT